MCEDLPALSSHTHRGLPCSVSFPQMVRVLTACAAGLFTFSPQRWLAERTPEYRSVCILLAWSWSFYSVGLMSLPAHVFFLVHPALWTAIFALEGWPLSLGGAHAACSFLWQAPPLPSRSGPCQNYLPSPPFQCEPPLHLVCRDSRGATSLQTGKQGGKSSHCAGAWRQTVRTGLDVTMAPCPPLPLTCSGQVSGASDLSCLATAAASLSGNTELSRAGLLS
jgi:hypothetical protein